MKILRDLSGADLVKALPALDYERVRQDGAHLRLPSPRGGQHHITLGGILKAVAAHHKLTIEELGRQVGL